MPDFNYVASLEYDEHIKQQNLQDDGSGLGVPAFDPLTNRYPALKEQIGQWRGQGMSDADIDNGLAEQERELRLSGRKTPADLDALFGRTEYTRGLDKTWLLRNKTAAIAQITGEPENDVKARTIDAFKLGIPASTAIEHPEIHKRLVGEFGTRLESNPITAFWDAAVGEARNSEQAALLGGYIKKLTAGPLMPEDQQKLIDDVQSYRKRLAMQQSVEPDGFLAYIAKNAGELMGQQIPGISAGLKKYGLPMVAAGAATALAIPTGGLSLSGAGVALTPALVGGAATAAGTAGAYEDMMNREALETFLELMQDPKNQTPEGQVQSARIAMAKGMINAYIELGTLGNIGRMLNIPGMKTIGLLPEKIKSAFTRFLGSPAALGSPTAANFLKRYAGTYLKNVAAESFEEAEQAFVGDAFLNFARSLNGDQSLGEAMGNLFSADELRELGLVYGQSAASFASGMLPGGLIRAGAGLTGLRAYNKTPQGKLHKALSERRDLQGEGDVVFLPREVLQTFSQSAAPAGDAAPKTPNIEETLGVTDADVVESTGEVMIPREKYEEAIRGNPALKAATAVHARYGAEGRTVAETAAAIRDNASDPINADTPFAKSARDVRDRKIQALKDAGCDDETAEAGGYVWAKYALRRAYALGENELGILRPDALTPAELDRLEIEGERAAENPGGNTYAQLLGPRGSGALDAYEESTSRLDALDSARRMEKRGGDTLAIRLATGWERGADGKWRYEIPDGALKPDMLDKPGTTALGEVFNAPELYRAYPELADIAVEVKSLPAGRFGSYNPHSRVMELNLDEIKKDPAEARRTVVHEIQHAIQVAEGFAPGGDQNKVVEAMQKQRRAAEERYDKVANKLKRRGVDAQEYEAAIRDEEAAAALRRKDEEQKNAPSYTPEHRARVADVIAYKEQKIRQIEDTISPALRKEFRAAYAEKRRTKSDWERASRDSFQTYRALGGEVEARTAERRADMSVQERLNTLLADTEDVAREDQIFLTSGLDEEARIQAEQEELKRQGRLKQDRIAWGRAVDRFVAGGMDELETSRVMDMPLALQLAGAPVNEIVAGYKFFSHTLRGKHSVQITPALMKKLVTSLADPIMVFDSDSHPGTSLVAMLELEDNQGATIITPVRLQMDLTDPKSPAILTSFYGKGDNKTGIPSNRWFVTQIKKGNLRYINTKKSTRWSSVSGLQLPKALAPTGSFKDSIKTEADLVKLRKENGNRFYQSVAGTSAPIVREGVTRKPDSAPAKIVHLAENAVPKFERMKDFRNWLKSLLMADGNPPVTIQSTGARAVFTGSNVEASLKRSRSEEHREAYAALREMISLAEYDHFEPADTGHPHVQGQDVYHAALDIGGKLYSVRLKLDVPLANNANAGSVVYKDHKLTEIEIAPALYGMESENQSHTQETDAISTVSLGVLRGNVKPSSYDGAHLSQERRGQIRIGSHGEGLVTLFKNADRSTFFHEIGHMMLDDLIADGLLDKANARTRADLETVKAYLGIEDMDLSKRHTFTGKKKERYAEVQERFARSFEAYLMEGKSPTAEMRGVFARVRQWLIDIYHDLSRLDVELSPEVREVFDHLLATPDEVDAARTTVGELALEESLLKQRLEELEGMEDLLPDEEYEKGYRKGFKKGVKAGRKREIEARRVKVQALKAAQAKRRAERKEINDAVKYMKRAVGMKSLSWRMQQAIRQKLERYTLKRPNAKRLEAARELLEYIEQTPDAELEQFNPADQRYIRMLETTTLNDMTLADVRALRQEIEDLVNRGREEFDRWEAERNSRREKWFVALNGDLAKTKRAENAGGIVTNSADIGKQYTGVGDAAARVKDWAYANTLGANRFFDWLGGGDGDYKSAWTRLFVDEVNKAFDAELRRVQERHLAMEEKMKELGVTAADLNKKVRIRGEAYSKDMLLHIYAGLQNENSRAAILYGNMRATWLKEGEEGVQRLAAECVGALSENEKKLAQAVMRDFNENFARINDACIDAYNMGMEQEKNYTPMSRLEFAGQSLNNLFDIDEAAMMKGRQQTAGAARAHVEKGFMQNRIKDLAPENQKPIELGLMSVWHDQVETQEHTAAYAKLAGDLNSVLMKRDKATGRTLGAEVNDRFGHDAVANLREYANIAVQGQNVTANAVMNSVSSYFGRNMAVAYLCLNLGTVLKQLTSIPRFLISANYGHLMTSIARFAAHPQAMLEKVYTLDPQMKNRAPDAFMNVLRGARAKETNAVKLKYLNALETMMKPISYADRLVSSIGWWATYQSNLKNGLSKEAAVREAQRAVALTQQTPLAKDMPRLWNQQGVARLMMIFTSDMANTWGMTVYDLAHTKDGKKILSTVTALAMTAALMGFAEGGPDDDDDWILWMMNKFVDQQISAAPLVGKEIMSALSVFVGDGYHQATYSSLAAPFVKLMQGAGGMSAADSDKVYGDGSTKFERSMFKALEGVSLLTPFPFTAANRIRRIVRAEDAGEAARVLFGMRIRKK